MSAKVQTLTVTLPEGEHRTVPAQTPLREVLPFSSQAIAARVNGKVVDLSYPLKADCEVVPVVPTSAEGVEVIRHSSAHLMAQAVKRLFPNVQITIGPVIENGFYYDFKHDRAFTPEDLERIEATMHDIVKDILPVRLEDLPRQEAIRLFRDMGEHYKVEILEGISDDVVSLYRQGEFVDLCRGPHVPSTGRIPAFKLTSVAGAYWRGDERNEMLQRIYGTAFASEKELRQHLALLEEAKRRDHRRLGKELDLFSFHPVAPGSPFFHPKGAFIYNELIAYIRHLYQRYGSQEVVTPQICDVELWQRSGHIENYKENIFFTEIEGRDFAVKPMNCPGHILLYTEKKHSYRELPLRYADFGRLHRFERSGVVSGLTRVRSFAQDDAHIFCAPEQIEAEVSAVLRMVNEVYRTFGFAEVRFDLSTRPPKRLGSIERFIGVLIEHCGGDFPLWLAPVQVRILTVTDSQEAYARQVHQQLLQAGMRSELDLRNEKLGYKVREAEVQKVPYMIVIGDKEVSTATVSPRGRKGEKISPLSVEDFIARVAAERVPGGAP